jgi:hypothetical protein
MINNLIVDQNNIINQKNLIKIINNLKLFIKINYYQSKKSTKIQFYQQLLINNRLKIVKYCYFKQSNYV